MGIFSKSLPSHLIPIDPANSSNKDWLILIEAGTIVGPSTDRIRVARSTQERKVVRRYDLFLKAKHYLVVEGYNPRIHAVYLCPQLYKYDANQKLVPLQGEEIGQLIAHALSNRVAQRRPWYEPSEKLPDEPIIGTQALTEFDTVVVEMPAARNSPAKAN
ncbi:MAG: hypothetical protein WAR76_14830 [Xanthobacteraceae bacterium]|jgi:hypothetical protein